MEQMHNQLKLQIRRYFGEPESLPKEWQGFITAVNTDYVAFDAGRAPLERAPELTPQLLEANPDFRVIFELLIHSSMDGIFAFDRDYRYTVWNPAVERILGLNRLQTLGQSAFDVFPFLNDTGGDKFYRDALAGKTVIASDRLYIVPGAKEQIFVEGHFSPLLDDTGKIVGGLAILRDISERKRAEALHAEKSRQAALRADIGIAFASDSRLETTLQACAEAIVRQLDAAFARIWTINEDGHMLELRASAGMYTHLEGPHGRVSVGKLKIGLIAQERSPHLTNDVLNDPRISDRAWAEREGMVAFAGYPLVVGDRLVGVMAMFSRKALTPDCLDALASVASLITQGIERKRAEDSLKKSEAYLAEAQRLSHTGSFGWNVSSGEIFWSDETFRIFGYGQANCKPTLELVLQRVHQEDIALVQRITDHASHDGKDFDFEHRLRMPDGSIKYLHVVAHAAGNEVGKHEFVGAVNDVTERKRAEAALRERERELQQLVDVVPHNILVMEKDGIPLYVNQGLREYFGFTLKDLQANDFRTRIYHPDDLDRVWSERQDAMSRGVAWETEARILRRDGQYRWFLIRSNPHRDAHGRIVRWYSTGTDIEDRMRAEDALRRAQMDLQRERDRLKLLLELTNQIVSNLELREMLRALAASIRRITQCDAVSIRLPDPENIQLHALEQLLAQRPDDPTLENALGYTLADHSLELPRAEGLIRRALTVMPDSPAALDSLGWVHFRRGDARGAAPTLERAYSIDHDAEIAAHWGEALWASGEQSEARKVWASALARQPESKPLKATLERFIPDAK